MTAKNEEVAAAPELLIEPAPKSKHLKYKGGGLRYVGDGTAISGIPKSDLADEELTGLWLSADELIASDLYVERGK